MKRIGGNINQQESLKKNCHHFMGFRHPYILKNHNDKTCFLIDMSVPNDINVSHKTLKNEAKIKTKK